MADAENMRVCLVCSYDYQVEGEHVPRILPCFHTVCEKCIKGKLGTGNSLECPQCGIEHTRQNDVKNVQENKYIISYIKKMAEAQPAEMVEKPDMGRKQCSKHGKELNIFCNQSGCQMPICLMCLKDEHKAHDFCDLQEVAEERSASVLDDVRSMKKILQEKKEDLLAVQKIVTQNCQECSKEIVNVKADLISEIDSRGTNLVRDITEEKEKTTRCINDAVAEIDEDLIMLCALEKKTNSETVFQIQMEMKKLEKLKEDKIDSRFPEAARHTYLTYKTCSSMSKLKHLSVLCGKLTKKTKRIQSKKVKARAKYAIPADDTDKENKVTEQEVVCASGGSLFHINGRIWANLSAMTSTPTNSGEQNLPVNGSFKNNETTNSLLVEDISMDEEDHSNEKVQENAVVVEDIPTEVVDKVYGPIAEVGPLKESVEMAKKSCLPSDNDLFCGQECNAIDIQPAYNMTRSILPADDACSGIQPASGVDGSTQPTLNMVRNIQPTENAVQNDQPAGNAIFYRRPQNSTTVNLEPLDIIPLFPQPASDTFPPAKNASVFVQPAEENLVYGYQASAMYGCQVYGQMNASTGSKPSTVSSIRDTPDSDTGDTLNSLVHHADNPNETRSDQVSQNLPLQRSVLTQSTVYGFQVDPNGNYLKYSNTDGIRSAPCHDESGGRNTTGCGSRDPRKSRSLLYGQRAEARSGYGGDPEAKKARLELTLQVESRANYRVLQSVSTGYEKLNVMDLLPDDTIIVSGRVHHKWSSRRQSLRPKLTKYDMNSGRMVYSSWYTCAPDGMAIFTTVAGDQWLALSYGKRQTIEFCDINNLRTALPSYSVAPDYPGRLCTSPPGTLVYTDCKPNKQVVRWLDFSSYPPTPTDKRTKIQTRAARDCFVQDMCFITHEGKQLLITTHNRGGVHAYLAGTDDLEWCVRGRQPGMDSVINAGGVTANGGGQLLVCDINNACIQMLSMNGAFLGTVLRSGDQRLGNPLRIRWCSKTETLVIAHEKQGLCSISIFQC